MKVFVLALLAAALSGVVAPASAADPKPFIKGNTPCGSAENIYFCLNFTPDDQARKTISDLKVRFPGAGQALVTWSGTVFCKLTPSTPDSRGRMLSEHEYYVYLGLKDDDSPYVYNEPGTAALGEKFLAKFTGRNRDAKLNDYTLVASRVDMKPVTLTRLYKIGRAQTVTYTAIGFADFKSGFGGAFCNVNGGAMTVQYMPK